MNTTEGQRDAPHNAVHVHDASRILECSQTERQRRVQYLVRHYLSQILHGCKSAYCDTPTCLSSSKRTASKPHRPPTLLTAVALAHYLAGQDNPNRGLCPHQLKTPPESFEIASSLAEQVRVDSAGNYAVYPAIGQLAQQRQQSFAGSSSGDGAATQAEGLDGDLISALRQRQRVRKDPKALSQNFSTRTAPGVPIVPKLSCDILDKLKEDVLRYGDSRSTDLNYIVDFDPGRRTRRAKPLVNRSLFYALSDPQKLLASFHDANPGFKDSPLPHLDSSRLVNSFHGWNHRNGALIFDSLWLALEALFTCPPELVVQKSPHLRPSRKGASTDSQPGKPTGTQDDKAAASRYLDTNEAAHIVMICIHALTSLVPVGWPHTWAQIRKLRSWGVMVPDAAPHPDKFVHPYMEIIDELEYEPAIRLADRLLRAIGARTCFEHILASLDGDADTTGSSTTLMGVVIEHLEVLERISMAMKLRLTSNHDLGGDPGWTVTATFMEWLRTIIVKKWESKAEINKWSSVGTAVMILDKLHSRQQALYLNSKMFEMPILHERIDTVNEPINYLTWEHHPNTLHIFEYPCLFSKQHLVAYFRTINFTEMMKQYDHTMRTHQMQRSLEMFLQEPYWWEIKRRTKVTLSDYLVLDVSREEPLKDTLDQLWGQDKRMLLKPLKVKMGHKEGEVGLDHGGVTYEFFRVVLSEAFRPENGMFTIDPQTRMTWFQPQSLEPKWKFEMLGILFSLAVYNGITLPITFPLAFYDCLQSVGNPLCKRVVDYDALGYIRDGWPSLAEGFQKLLSWRDGDVSDVFMREYIFSYEAFGQIVNQNLSHESASITTPPEPSQEEPDLVTNTNREQYVRAYVRALTYDSIAPQLTSFIRGFLTCINAKSLQLFTPSTLRHLIEGTQHISISDLKRCAKYEDGYTASHSNIRAFWDVVEDYSQEDLRHLLEFVTASDRVPVTGYESITFHIVRIAGAESGGLPSSSTCFGKLYLPDYQDKKILEKKLGLAIRNSKGFGNV
ncbi:unnamed protein product [Alternaria alternata]